MYHYYFNHVFMNYFYVIRFHPYYKEQCTSLSIDVLQFGFKPHSYNGVDCFIYG